MTVASAVSNHGGFASSRTVSTISTPHGTYPRVIDEFWTARQRQLHSLHYALSYRGSFKPELPDFFIRQLTVPGDVVADPFGGRGTTILQANLLGRPGFSNDINPLSERMVYPKTRPVSIEAVEARLDEIPFNALRDLDGEEDLSMFYHRETYRQLLNLRDHLRVNRDDTDRFIEMLAISRLHGHSPGFFSAYSFPQISIPKENQAKINQARGVEPDWREVKSRLVKKARTALKDGGIEDLREVAQRNLITTEDSRHLKSWPDESVQLVVTSPPFLNQVDYVTDNWLELWFCDIDAEPLRRCIVQTADLDIWMRFVSDTLHEMHRVLKPGGWVAWEVGEVRYEGRLINLDETVISLVESPQYNGGEFKVERVYVQSQNFTKLANCFNVKNNVLGTNTNRIVLMQKI